MKNLFIVSVEQVYHGEMCEPMVGVYTTEEDAKEVFEAYKLEHLTWLEENNQYGWGVDDSDENYFESWDKNLGYIDSHYIVRITEVELNNKKLK